MFTFVKGLDPGLVTNVENAKHRTTREFSEGFIRTDTSSMIFIFISPPLLFSFVRSRLTWDPAARERGSRAGIDSGRGSACCCREIDRRNSAERARRWGLTTPIVAVERAWALARLITSEWPFDDHDRPTRRTRKVRATEKERRRQQREKASMCDRSERERRREHRLRALPEWRG